MSDQDERTVGDLTLRVDRDACVAFEHCAEEAPEAFELGEDGIVKFTAPEAVSREQLVRACLACPVEALHALDKNGEEITVAKDPASAS